MYPDKSNNAEDQRGKVDFGLVAKLVKKVQRGDQKAFSELYQLYFQRVHYAAYRYLGDTDDAAEITQEVFGQVYKKLGDMRSPIAFHRWINRIVYNLSVNVLKKRESEQKHMGTRELDQYEALLAEDNRDFLPESCLESKEDQAAVLDAVDGLTIAQKAAIVMYYFENMSVKDIAKATDASEEAVYKRLFDAKTALKKEFDLRAKTSKLSVAGAAVPVLSRIFYRDANIVSNPQLGDSVYSSLVKGLEIAGGAAAGTSILKVIADSVIGKVAIGAIGVALIGGGVALVGNLSDNPPSTEPDDVATSAQTLKLPESGDLPAFTPQQTQEETATLEPVKEPSDTAAQEPIEQTQQDQQPAQDAPEEIKAPIISISNDQLTYSAGDTVSLRQIIADAKITAVDANGKAVSYSVGRYEQIDFDTPGRYILYVTAIDENGNKAETAVIGVRIVAVQ